jgi:predicted permease
MTHALRVAARSFAHHPAFALTAVAVLALGIGANAAVFGLVDQALFAPPGIADPARVVAVRAAYGKLNLASINLSGPDFRDVRAAREVFERAAVMEQNAMAYSGAGQPQVLQAAAVSREWFEVFGVAPAIGRTFSADEDQLDAAPAVVLGHGAWVRLFGADRGIVGRTILLDQKPHLVVGVMPAGFRWPREVEVWTPLGLPPKELTDDYRFNEHLTCVARLKAGVRFEQASARVQAIVGRVKAGGDQLGAFARDAAWSMFAQPFAEYVAGSSKTPMLVLLGAVGFVLLIACANIAGLMVARTTGRGREIAVRAALGAGRWRLLRETAAESALLAGAGTVAGLAVAVAGMRLLITSAPEGAVVGLEPALDLRVALVAVAAAVVSAALFALAPAWQIARVAPFEQLKTSGRAATGGRGRLRLRSALVVAETALAVVLLVGAGLLVRSLANLQQVNPGFDPRGVMVGMIGLPASTYQTPESRAAFYHGVVERLSAMPGVDVAAAGQPLPFVGGDSSASFQIEGAPQAPGDPGPHGRMRLVDARYFAAMRIPVKRGRVFTADDRLGTQPVVVIDENLARRYWAGQDPVGRRILNGPTAFTIVGVVGDVLHTGLVGDTGKGTVYRALGQRPLQGSSLVVRLKPGAPYSPGLLSEAVRAVDPALPVQRVSSMDERVAQSLAPRRFVMRVLSFFGIVALLMAALGLYGVISYSVAQRTQEIGIRMAIGASGRAVVGLVLGQGIALAGIGLAVGLAGAVLAARLLTSQLYQVSPFDPVTFLVAAPVLLATAVAACWLPARRASRVDPLVALRCE